MPKSFQVGSKHVLLRVLQSLKVIKNESTQKNAANSAIFPAKTVKKKFRSVFLQD